MGKLIDLDTVIDAVVKELQVDGNYGYMDTKSIVDLLNDLPSAKSERTEYISDTKAVRSKRDYVDLVERVTAMFYDQEHEEWTQQTVTIADVLDSVCDKYTILPSAQPEQRWIPVDLQNNSPEENKAVLLGVRFRDDFKYFVTSRQDYNYWTGLGREINGELRWRPLPEPYRAESEE